MTHADTVPGALPRVEVPHTLADFEPLRRAERILLRACTHGDIARIGLRRPVAGTVDVTVRASLLAFLARGGGPGVQVGARRIEMLGAWIEGRLDLGDAQIAMTLWFYRCVFDHTPLLDGARVSGSVGFPDCRLPGLMAEGCSVRDDLSLNAGCSVDGEVRLKRAEIGGDLHCARMKLQTGERAIASRPLVADGIRVRGDVTLSEGFEAVGELRFVGARIGGDFRAGRARVTGHVDGEGARSAALVLDRAEIGGSVLLDAGFAAAGRVCLRRAVVGGDLDCTAAAFDRVGDAAWDKGVALVLDRAHIGGTLSLRRLQGPLAGASLADAKVKVLADDGSSWGERLVLDGFAYSRFAEGAPVDAAFRLAWLLRQAPAHLGPRDFRAHPWRRLIAVLRKMGHEAGAAQVAIQREHLLRRVGRIGAAAPAGWRWMPRAAHRLFGWFAGFGHRPQRLAGWAIGVWLASAALFWAAAEQGAIAPADPRVWADARFAACRAPDARWTHCAALPREHPAFEPLAYSLDRLLPLAPLDQARAWQPVALRPGTGTVFPIGWGEGARALGWLETLFGWFAVLIAIASLAGWTDRDRHAR